MALARSAMVAGSALRRLDLRRIRSRTRQDGPQPCQRPRRGTGDRTRFATVREVPQSRRGSCTVPVDEELLIRHGLARREALAAASSRAEQWLRPSSAASDSIVTYDTDPRDDPAILESPLDVVVRGRFTDVSLQASGSSRCQYRSISHPARLGRGTQLLPKRHQIIGELP